MTTILKFALFFLFAAAVSFALEPGVAVQSGQSILVPMVPCDDPTITALLVTSTDTAARTLIVEYTYKAQTYRRLATRPGPTAQSYALVLVNAPLAELSNISVTSATAGSTDRF